MDRAVTSALATLLAGCMFAVPAFAQEDVSAFYRGKQVRLVVGSGAGGGYDLFARAVARHLGDHIPGKPTIIVQNQGAAGGLLMTNQLYSLGPKDGTVIAAPVNSIPTAPLLEPGAARFDATKLNWIGSTNRETYVAFAWHTAPVQTLADLMRKPLIVGATTAGTTLVDFPLVANSVLGTRFKVVRGYDSTPQINVAIERGELEGNGGIGWQSVRTQTPEWITDRKITVIAQYRLQRDPALADAPTMLELAKTPQDRAALTMMFARTEYGRPYFAPPDVPAARVEALRRAFDATMRYPDFIADAAQLQLELSPMRGEDVQRLVTQLADTPSDVAARVRAALETPRSRQRLRLPGSPRCTAKACSAIGRQPAAADPAGVPRGPHVRRCQHGPPHRPSCADSGCGRGGRATAGRAQCHTELCRAVVRGGRERGRADDLGDADGDRAAARQSHRRRNSRRHRRNAPAAQGHFFLAPQGDRVSREIFMPGLRLASEHPAAAGPPV